MFCDRAHDEEVSLSFGRIGTAADNAAMEAFWSVLKRELFHLERHQARLEHQTPVEYESNAKEAA